MAAELSRRAAATAPAGLSVEAGVATTVTRPSPPSTQRSINPNGIPQSRSLQPHNGRETPTTAKEGESQPLMQQAANAAGIVQENSNNSKISDTTFRPDAIAAVPRTLQETSMASQKATRKRARPVEGEAGESGDKVAGEAKENRRDGAKKRVSKRSSMEPSDQEISNRAQAARRRAAAWARTRARARVNASAATPVTPASLPRLRMDVSHRNNQEEQEEVEEKEVGGHDEHASSN
ncbi:MAG: hypothetical protein Q9225_007849 [Loekoesia sp. 1 TL-2023]